jgi:3-isopropylmalate dehydrogenase
MKIAVLPCDAIGPEITAATLTVLDATRKRYGLDLDLAHHDVGLAALARHGTTLPQATVAAVESCDGFILGPHDNMSYPPAEQGGVNVSAFFRKHLDLYANIRPARTMSGLGRISAPLDLVIVRENTEGFYADRNMFLGSGEFMPTQDLALSVRKISAKASERIARAAFELAATRPRRKVTAVHKVNVLKLGEGLFLREVRKVAEVVVTTNLYGDVLSDEASELAGGLGLAASINAGDGIAMAQAQHGSAPDIAGQDLANPTSLILSSAMLLDWLGRKSGSNSLCDAARAVTAAVEQALGDPACRTADLGGPLGTGAFGQAVAERL